MKNEIAKPMSVERSEFIFAITDLIKTANLPFFVIETILRDLYNDVHALSQKELEEDVKRYKEQLPTMENKNQ